MGNIGEIVSLMHKFTPKGQEMALKILRREKDLLDKPYEFMELPQRLAKSEELGCLEREMLGNSYLSENLYELWAKNVSHLNSDTKFMTRYQEIIKQTSEAQRNNQVKLIQKNKKKVVKFIEQECKDKKLAQKMRQSSSAADILDCSQLMFAKYLIPQVDMETYKQMVRGKLEYFQEGYKQLLKYGDLDLKFWKMLLPDSKDKRVIEISELLKKEYGMIMLL